MEGWAPEPRDTGELAHLIDVAFDYRGDVTLVMRDGSTRVGYVFDRHPATAQPYLRLFEPAGGPPVTVRYADLRTIHFTGRDTASGKSYTAWLERKRADGAGTTQSA